MNAPEVPLVDVTRSAILIVDDNPHNLAAFEASLEGIHADVIRASSGQQALRCLLERDFAVIVLDVKMPDLDGFETAKIIRSRSRTQHTPIIFATAYSRDDTQVLEAYKMGAVDFLFKPITSEVLRAKVSVFIELRRRAEEVRVQAEQLREHQRREHERVLAEEKHRWDEAAMRKRLEELAQADQRKDEFLAMLGHELRNPLAPIVTGLSIIRGPLLATVEAETPEARAFATVDRQVRHLRRLVDDLLDISRINCGKIQLEPEFVDLNGVVEQAVATARPALDERGHDLAVRLASPGVPLYGDPLRLTQVISNLLHNAARYTNPGGRIAIEVRHDSTHAIVAVSDNGTGIDPALMPTIFDIFVQRRPSANGGLGLGLTLVRRLVELHGGEVSAASEGLDKGSQFTVRFPLPTADVVRAGRMTPVPGVPLARTAPASAPEPPRAGGGRVVVVDDNADIRDTLCDLLVSWGYDVRAARDGEEGIRVICEHRPAVAFVDVGMPRMDGHEVARTIRRMLGARPKLIAMTGFGRQSDRVAAGEAGFDAYLVKPIDLDDILQFLPKTERPPAPVPPSPISHDDNH